MERDDRFTDERIARQTVADAGRRLLADGLVARTWGNISCRTGSLSYVITPSGLGYDVMTAEDVVPYSMADGSFSGARKPSSEKGIHTAAYARFPDAGFVIHTHQCYASAIGLAGFDRLSLTDTDAAALGGVSLAQYGLPGTKTLSRNVENALKGGAHCVLMAHHGVLIVGRDQAEAFSRAMLLERLCRSVCADQPAEESGGDTAALGALAASVGSALGHVGYTSTPAVVAASMRGALPTQLDDMAQMIGARLVCAAPEKDALAAALSRHDAVLVKGLGAMCRAQSEGDLTALNMLVEKACVAFLHTSALGAGAKLSFFDTLLMRRIYVQKYSKKIGG